DLAFLVTTIPRKSSTFLVSTPVSPARWYSSIVMRCTCWRTAGTSSNDVIFQTLGRAAFELKAVKYCRSPYLSVAVALRNVSVAPSSSGYGSRIRPLEGFRDLAGEHAGRASGDEHVIFNAHAA